MIEITITVKLRISKNIIKKIKQAVKITLQAIRFLTKYLI